jgi:predicted flap endonuclease-1-like 5' DNA nuclease
MRRSRLIAVVLLALLGLWMLWRQFVQRQQAMHPHHSAPESSLPVWIPAPRTNNEVKKLASTAERTHNQSDALTQPPEPAPPPLPDTGSELLAAVQEHEPSEASDALTQPQEPAPPPLPDTDSEPLAAVQEHEPSEDMETESETATPAPDDLIRIEGIGPKISTIVAAAGITSFAELARQEVARLEVILDEAGIHTANPSTWPEQAGLAAQGKWQELKELQDRIKNGRLEA